MKTTLHFVSSAILIGLTDPVANAQKTDNDDGWTIGGSIIYDSSILEGGDDLLAPFPFASFDKGRFHGGFDGVSYDILSRDTFILAILETFRDAAFSGDDVDENFDTIERGAALEVGLAAHVQGFLMSMMGNDPVQLLSDAGVRTIIVQGEKDLKVSVRDAPNLSAVHRVELILLPHVNHVLNDVLTDNADNLKAYSHPERPLASGLVDVISSFVLESDQPSGN